MDIREMLLDEFDTEMALTRRVLERVPMERADFRPAEKSMTLGQLANHISRLPFFVSVVATRDGYDFAAADPTQWQKVPATRDELVANFDRISAGAREALAGLAPGALGDDWALRAGDHVVASGSRWSIYRRLAMNHVVHHRAQLGVYLRLLDVPIPGSYGPSADEPIV